MTKALIALIALVIPCIAFGAHFRGPQDVIPEYLITDYNVKGGLFGDTLRYEQDVVDIINIVEDAFHQILDEKIEVNADYLGDNYVALSEAIKRITDKLAEDTTYNVDLFAYGDSTVTAEVAFAVLGQYLIDNDISGLTSANWATAIPATIPEALERMATLLKTLNSGTAIPALP